MNDDAVERFVASLPTAEQVRARIQHTCHELDVLKRMLRVATAADKANHAAQTREGVADAT